MWDDKRRDRAFWGAAALAVGLFIWVYSHSPNGEGDFADSPPSLAPSAAIQVASPPPVSEIPALSPSPSSPSSSRASSVILPVSFGREIAFESPAPPPPPSGSPPSASASSPKPTP